MNRIRLRATTVVGATIALLISGVSTAVADGGGNNSLGAMLPIAMAGESETFKSYTDTTALSSDYSTADPIDQHDDQLLSAGYEKVQKIVPAGQSAVEQYFDRQTDVMQHGAFASMHESPDALDQYADIIYSSAKKAGYNIRNPQVTVGDAYIVDRPIGELKASLESSLPTAAVEVTMSFEMEDVETGEIVSSSLTDWHQLELSGGSSKIRAVSDATIDLYSAQEAENTALEIDQKYIAPSPADISASDSRIAADMDAAGIVLKSAPGGVNTANMAAYALKWSQSTKMNPAYPDMTGKGGNCTNFASQALKAGGWPLKDGRTLNSIQEWTYISQKTGSPTGTWVNASKLRQHALQERGWTNMKNIWLARVGDLLMPDWQPINKPDGVVDHTMVVTGWSETKKEPRISQQQPPRNDILLSMSIEYAKRAGMTKIVWYGLIHK